MKAKINYDKLYVAFPVYDYEVETEMYVKYETFGTIEHRIIINPKGKLICSIIDENGIEKYYDYKTGEEVNELTYMSSFETKSSPWASIRCTYINGLAPLPISSIREEIISSERRKQKCVGYLIPFSQYVEEKLGTSFESISPAMADKILRLMNVGIKKSFMLSMDTEEAEKQLEKIGYHKNKRKSR